MIERESPGRKLFGLFSYGVYKIEYYTIANQKQARYNIDKKTKATATVQKIDFGCSHKEQIENRYPQWLKTLVCSAWRKLFE